MKKVKGTNVKPGNNKISHKVVCKRCRKSKKIHAKDLCELCYSIVRNEKSRKKKEFQVI
jgi:rRNA maturation endonuclease Nob1